MIYAIIENGIVTNIVIGPLPDALSGIAIGDYPVAIGDGYENGDFYRDGIPVIPVEESD
jgi:hypothetical protein